MKAIVHVSLVAVVSLRATPPFGMLRAPRAIRLRVSRGATIAQKAPAKGRARQIFVGVVDRAGSPILDLQPGDFDVKERATALPEKMKALAAALGEDHNAARTEYQAEFATDATGSPAVDVGVAREGVTQKITQTRVR